MLLSFQGLLRPANGWTDSWTRNDRAANVSAKDWAATDPTKKQPSAFERNTVTQGSDPADQAMRFRIVMLVYERTLEGMICKMEVP